MRKILKIFVFSIISIIILVYISWMVVNEPVPSGKEGEKAEQLANKMLSNLNYEAYDSVTTLSWSFPGGHHFRGERDSNRVNVKWDQYEVSFYTETKEGTVTENGNPLSDSKKKEQLIREAWEYFANDSFWMVAPFKVRDPGTSRYYIETEDGPGLLVTYSSGGVTPGDTYLWVLDENYRPKYWKMWVKIIPVGGLKFTWEGWENRKGVWLSTLHKGPLSFELEMKNISLTY